MNISLRAVDYHMEMIQHIALRMFCQATNNLLSTNRTQFHLLI